MALQDQTKWSVFKKRGRSSPGEINTPKKKLTDYWLSNSPIETSNKYEKLQTEQTSEQKNTDEEKAVNEVKLQKSPPIYVCGVENIKPLKELLNTIASNNYTLKVLPNNEVKIQPNSSEKYLPIVEELKKKKTEFYTYQMKRDKTYKVVLRNMHPSTDIEEIKVELEKFGHKIVRIANIRQRITHKPLPVFFIEIVSDENNKKIFEINKLLNTIVNFEPPHKKRDIPQCMKCQGFGHTKNYCHRSPTCVKCAKNHLTKECPVKGKIEDVKCANCEGNHPASYKGCLVRKQLQQKLYPKLREKVPVENEKNSPSSSNNFIKTNVSYAQAASSGPQQFQTEYIQTQPETQIITKTDENINTSKLEEMMLQLMIRMDTMLNLLTSLVNKIQ